MLFLFFIVVTNQFSENQLYSFFSFIFCVDRYNEFRLIENFSDNLNGKKQATN